MHKKNKSNVKQMKQKQKIYREYATDGKLTLFYFYGRGLTADTHNPQTKRNKGDFP